MIHYTQEFLWNSGNQQTTIKSKLEANVKKINWDNQKAKEKHDNSSCRYQKSKDPQEKIIINPDRKVNQNVVHYSNLKIRNLTLRVKALNGQM